MVDYTNLKQFSDIKDQLLAAKFSKVGGGGVIDKQNENLENLCKAAELLCDTVNFTSALENVSRKLWIRYNAQPPDTRNRFTRALRVLAEEEQFIVSDNGGVSSQPESLVLTDGGDQNFLSYVQKRYFWKDVMNNEHGEHTHSLQWLAIYEILGAVTPKLYSMTAQYRCSTKDKDKHIYLWSWLVDAFPQNLAGAAPSFGGKEVENSKLVANDFRTPQFFMNYFVRGFFANNLQDNFVAAYLYRRYINRNWISREEDTYDENGIVTKGLSEIKGDSAGKWKSKNQQNQQNQQWKVKTDASGTYERKVGADKTTPKDIRTIKCKFHGVDGKLTMGNNSNQ
ncbi:LirA/MavJ family T4SS effector [Methylomonas albis]|uniref:DUF5636 domain-containing protein n=1 Tax=Methylomonas albis TaxID=1854563 RepID=A0ABR9CUN5_9GAMM|nr:LirA/MavJ family T4SS effector [Methylomonas albis]MBD9354539.1 hypothetical protein [Methylomonas albis]